MKNTLILCGLLLCGLFAGGCTSQSIATQESEVTVASTVATTGVLSSISDQTNRVATAREAYDVATSITSAINTNGTLDTTDLEALATSELDDWNSPYAPLVGGIVQLLDTMVDGYIANYYSTASSAVQVEDATLLINAGAQGVASASSAFTAGSPASVLSAGPLKSTGPIPIIHHAWNGWTPATKGT